MAKPMSDRTKAAALRELAREISSAADAHIGYALMNEENRHARLHPQLPTTGEMGERLADWANRIHRIVGGDEP